MGYIRSIEPLTLPSSLLGSILGYFQLYEIWMSKLKEPIDYLDLYIPVSPTAAESFARFIADFIENHLYIEINPKLKDGVLLINSTDLVAFTGYIDPEECFELDLFRFKTDSKKQLEQQLLKSLSLQNQAHYKWCLGAITSKEYGRFLDKSEDSDD